MSHDPINTSKKLKPNYFLIITFIIAIGGLFLPKLSAPPSNSNGTGSALESIKKSKVLRIGYEGYPPYTIEDPSSGKLTGYSVDMAEYIAKEAGWTVKWVKTNPDTKITDIETGKFDVMVEPIFQTIPRAENVTFTNPYAYFGYAAGIVKKGNSKFRRIEDLNQKGVKIAVRLGYTDQTFAQENFPLAEIRAMKVDDVSQVFQDVIAGNSDIALGDLEQVKAFASSHKNAVDPLFTNPPPALVAAGFMLRQGDFEFYNFLNASITYLETNGIFDNLDKKYHISVFREKKEITNINTTK